MFGYSWRIGRVRGIEIKVDVSWLLIVALMVHSIYLRLDELYPDELEPGAMVALAAAAAVAFFGSVLAHELAHSLMAQRRGAGVRGITLFLFGGVTETKAEGRGPRDELAITIVGPLSSLALAAIFGIVAHLAGDTADPVPGTIGYLGWVNLGLALFNLIPGLPLDGGRVLRSILWQRTGSIEEATRIAARGGQILGWVLTGFGLLNVAFGFLGGLWFVAIGWFLGQAAQMSYTQTVVDRILRGIVAEDVMAEDLVAVPAHLSVQEAIDHYFMRHDHSAFPVVDGGEIVGLLSLRRVRQVPDAGRARTPVHEVMSPIARMPTVTGRTPMNEVMQHLEQSPDARVLVQGPGGRIEGIITAHDVTRWMRRGQELGLAR